MSGKNGLKRRATKATALLGAATLLWACFGPTDSEGKHGGRKATVTLVPVTQATVGNALPKRVAGVKAADLQSFQVAFEGIFLAKEINTNGSAWNGADQPFEFFNVEELRTDKSHNRLNPGNALDAANDKFFVDLMTAEGRAKIAQSAEFDESLLGEYNWISVQWAYPFRVRAAAPLGDGRTVYTKPGTLDTTSDNTDAQIRITRMAGDVFSGPAETTVAVKNNGGALFHFLRPLVLGKDDLTGTKMVHDTSRRDGNGNVIDTLVPAGKLQVMLVFNPDEFITAWDTAGAEGAPDFGELMGPGGVGNMKVPFLDATVIPYRDGQEVWRESYVFLAKNDQMHGNDSLRVRLEVYTVADNVMAFVTRALTGPQGEFPVEPVLAWYVKDEAGGTLRAEDNKHEPIVEGFRRLGTVGATGVCDLTMSMIKAPATAYTLVEKRKMN